MAHHDRKSALCEHKALVLQRFSLTDAQAMCGHDVPCFEAPDLSAPCPSCGSVDIVWLKPASISGHFNLCTDAQLASRLRCGSCLFSGDAVGYVMANFSIGNLDFALQRIEDWLDQGKPSASGWGPAAAPPPPRMNFKNTVRKRRKRVIR